MKTLFMLVFLLTVCFYAEGQTIGSHDSLAAVEKSRYREDLPKALTRNIIYPEDALRNNIQGDVVLSFTVSKTGKLNNLIIKSSPNVLLSTCASNEVNALENSWIPAKVNNIAIDRNYLLVFRFRIGNNDVPDFNAQAAKLIEKQKYDKALSVYDRSIRGNKYDYQLFELRSKVKGLLGDTEGAKNDLAASAKLKDEIMDIIYVTAFGVVRKAVQIDQQVIKL